MSEINYKEAFSMSERSRGQLKEKLEAFTSIGIMPEQVQKWATAAAEGRLVVLPKCEDCKYNDGIGEWCRDCVVFAAEYGNNFEPKEGE